MPEPLNLSGPCAREHLDNVIEADLETRDLGDAVDAREKLLRSHGPVECFARGETVVAASTGDLVECFAEVGEEASPPTISGFRVMDHLMELIARDATFLCVGLFLDECLLFDGVRRGEKEHAFAGEPVTSSPAGFLIITFDIFWQIVMDYEADVRFVDAHSEGDGGANHVHIIS